MIGRGKNQIGIPLVSVYSPSRTRTRRKAKEEKHAKHSGENSNRNKPKTVSKRHRKPSKCKNTVEETSQSGVFWSDIRAPGYIQPVCTFESRRKQNQARSNIKQSGSFGRITKGHKKAKKNKTKTPGENWYLLGIVFLTWWSNGTGVS